MPRTSRDSRALPIDATRAERILWFHLRDRRLARLRFWRRQPFSGFVPDFYCPTARLIISLVGRNGTGEAPGNDVLEGLLATRGILVLRVTNRSVRDELASVLRLIEKIATERGGQCSTEPETLATRSAGAWPRDVRWGRG